LLLIQKRTKKAKKGKKAEGDKILTPKQWVAMYVGLLPQLPPFPPVKIAKNKRKHEGDSDEQDSDEQRDCAICDSCHKRFPITSQVTEVLSQPNSTWVCDTCNQMEE
jgi:hypothetical protein